MYGGVEIAAPGAHDQPLQRRQTHRRVDRLPARTAVADAPLPRCRTTRFTSCTRLAQHPGRLGDHEGVRGPVEAVAPDLVLVAPRPRDGIRVGHRRHGLVERGVEDRDLRDSGEQRARDPQALEVRRVVQRRQRHQLGHRVDHLVVDQDRFAETDSAVDHPVTDRGDLGRGQRGTVLLERLQGGPERLLEGREGPLGASASPPACCAPGVPAALPDALDATGGRLGTGLGVDQAVLQRRRAGVDDQHLGTHDRPLRLDRGDRDGVDDVAHGGTARQVVDRLAQPLQDRTDGERAGRALHRLVGVVAGVQVGEDEHGRAAGHLGVGQLGPRHGGVDGGVVLDRALDREVGRVAHAPSPSPGTPSRRRRRSRSCRSSRTASRPAARSRTLRPCGPRRTRCRRAARRSGPG